jgi:hypothetical protein
MDGTCGQQRLRASAVKRRNDSRMDGDGRSWKRLSGRSPLMSARPNIVLVHGAWADGSSWSAVIERLHADG